MLDNIPNKPSTFRAGNGWNKWWLTWNVRPSMLKSRLCDYIDACILVYETVTVTGAGTDDTKIRLDEINE